MKSFLSHLSEAAQERFVYRWVPKVGYSASTAGNVYGWYLDFGRIVRNEFSGAEGVVDPFNPEEGQAIRSTAGWKPLARLSPSGRITQKVIDSEIERQRQIWREWRRDPAGGGLPDAHETLARIMRVLTGRNT